MNMIPLGKTGVDVSTVSLGTWSYGGLNKAGDVSVGWSHHDDGLAKEALHACYEAGIWHWDTADVYGDGRSEALIGEVWDKVDRSKIFLASKVGWDPGTYGHFYHPSLIRERLERSLTLLKTDSLDLYYLHHCDFGPNDQYLDDALAEMEKARDAGKFKFLGLSDWDSAKVASLIDRVNPDVVQPYRNVLDDAYASSGLKKIVDERNLGIAFFSTLRHGLLTGKYEAPTSFPDGDFRRQVDGFTVEAQVDHFRKCVDAMRSRFPDKTEPVLHALIGTVLSDAASGCALVGMRNRDQVKAAAKVGEPLSTVDATWVKDVYRAWST